MFYRNIDRFDVVSVSVRNGLFGKKETKKTFRNIKTGKLCKRSFDDAVSYYPYWHVVRIGDKWTFFNPSTEKLCKYRFNGISREDCDVSMVEIDNKWMFYNQFTQQFFKKTFTDYNFAYIYTALKEYPEDFELLPTSAFRHEKDIQCCLEAIAEGVKGICSEKGSTKEAEEYAKGIYALISQKIEKEKKNIAIENIEIEKNKQAYAEKEKVVEKVEQDIKNLGKNLGGKE